MKKLILINLIFLSLFNCSEVNETEKLLTKIDSLKIENDSLKQQLNKERTKPNYWFDEDYDGAKLLEIGIKNPEKFIQNNLRQRPDLIPLKSTLGGTMHFGNIQLLSNEWLIADFDDDHVRGKAIYKYKLNTKGQLDFQLLNSIGPE